MRMPSRQQVDDAIGEFDRGIAELGQGYMAAPDARGAIGVDATEAGRFDPGSLPSPGEWPGVPLRSILDHPAMMEAQPWSADIPVTVGRLDGALGQYMPPGKGAPLSAPRGQIELDRNAIADHPAAETMDTLAHEAHHAAHASGPDPQPYGLMLGASRLDRNLGSRPDLAGNAFHVIREIMLDRELQRQGIAPRADPLRVAASVREVAAAPPDGMFPQGRFGAAEGFAGVRMPKVAPPYGVEPQSAYQLVQKTDQLSTLLRLFLQARATGGADLPPALAAYYKRSLALPEGELAAVIAREPGLWINRMRDGQGEARPPARMDGA